MKSDFAIGLMGAACAVAVLVGAASSVRAQGVVHTPAYPPYPAVKTPQAVDQWVRAQTDVVPTTVVGIGQDSIFSVEPGRDRTSGPWTRVVIRQEAIDPDFTRRLGGRSAVMTVDLDCAKKQVFQRGLELYAGSNRQGAVRRMGEGTEWRAIPPGSYMDKVLEASCTSGYRPVFAAAPPPPAPYAPPAYSPAPTPRPAYAAPVAPPAAYARAPAAPAPANARPPRAYAASAQGPAGRVEYGRFASTADALQAAQDLAAAYPQVLAGKQRRVELSTTGGRVQFRGMVEGFSSRTEAESFCRRLQSEGRACAGAS